MARNLKTQLFFVMDMEVMEKIFRYLRHIGKTLCKKQFYMSRRTRKCAVNPNGYQWFDLIDESLEQILSKSLVAEIKLNQLIDEVKENLNLDINKLALVGFSQGCMISLQTGLKRTDQISSIIGYSGKIISKDHLKKNIKSKPNIMLMHGDRDEVVNISSFLEAKEFFNDIKYPISSKIFKNCEHRIPTEGSSLGLQFLKKNHY